MTATWHNQEPYEINVFGPDNSPIKQPLLWLLQDAILEDQSSWEHLIMQTSVEGVVNGKK